MLRLIVFAVLGPSAGYFVFISLAGGFKGPNAGVVFAMLLPVSWIAGLVPALVTAALDRLFERLGARSVQRYFLIALVGYASAYLLMLENYFEVEPLLPFQYSWGLVGAVPAVLCSFVTQTLELPAR